MTEPYRKTLIDSDQNINLGDSSISSRDISTNSPILWHLKLTNLHGGKQQGAQLLTLEIESDPPTTIRIIPTRGLNILDATINRTRLGWDSPVKEVVNPAFINEHSRGNLGWIDGFNEFIARCGLEWFGPPCIDNHHHAASQPPAGQLTLHGKISNIPASKLELIAQTEPPHHITIKGTVHERGLFTPNLKLESELTINPANPNAFTLTDRITNLSAQPQEFGILYHINQGTPILGQGATFNIPIKRVTPRDPRAAEGNMNNWNTYNAPQTAYAEQVYLIEPLADSNNNTHALLTNPAADRALSLTFNTAQLPRFTLWKNTAAPEEGYVTGLEPATGYPLPRPYERKQNRVPILQPNQTHTTNLNIALLDTHAAIAASQQQIATIQSTHQPITETTPPTIN